MFRFTIKPSSGSHSQYLAEITHSVQYEYMEVVQTLSGLWLHSMTCEACVLCCAQHTGLLCSHNTGNVCMTSMYSY
jgi:hypothetical protein